VEHQRRMVEHRERTAKNGGECWSINGEWWNIERERQRRCPSSWCWHDENEKLCLILENYKKNEKKNKGSNFTWVSLRNP